MPASFDPLELLGRFDLVGTPVSVEPYGSGHINQTFVSVYSQAAPMQAACDRAFAGAPAGRSSI